MHGIACTAAARTTIPRTCNKRNSDRMPGWSEHVKPLREKSMFWRSIWLDCGRPKTGTVADSMRRTRPAYHYAIRRVRKEEEDILRERIAVTMPNDSSRNFWAEIRRLRGRKTCLSQ